VPAIGGQGAAAKPYAHRGTSGAERAAGDESPGPGTSAIAPCSERWGNAGSRPTYEGRVGETQMQDNDRTGVAEAEKLRELARWYRGFAERAGSTTIWAARLRMADDRMGGGQPGRAA
jgi:hypothetical protein